MKCFVRVIFGVLSLSFFFSNKLCSMNDGGCFSGCCRPVDVRERLDFSRPGNFHLEDIVHVERDSLLDAPANKLIFEGWYIMTPGSDFIDAQSEHDIFMRLERLARNSSPVREAIYHIVKKSMVVQKSKYDGYIEDIKIKNILVAGGFLDARGEIIDKLRVIPIAEAAIVESRLSTASYSLYFRSEQELFNTLKLDGRLVQEFLFL